MVKKVEANAPSHFEGFILHFTVWKDFITSFNFLFVVKMPMKIQRITTIKGKFGPKNSLLIVTN